MSRGEPDEEICPNHDLIEVKFGTKGRTQLVTNGQILNLNQVQVAPIVEFYKEPEKLYTVMMIDPDAPSAANPINKYWLHMLIVNTDQIVAAFHPSNPPVGSGLHRYYFKIYEQSGRIDSEKVAVTRAKFNPKDFVTAHRLELIGCTYYMTERPQ
jgi:phosphatidylethanolamine-binding protein